MRWIEGLAELYPMVRRAAGWFDGKGLVARSGDRPQLVLCVTPGAHASGSLGVDIARD